MPKMKTHSASKKRFKKTASGKIKRTTANRRHHAWARSSKKIRQARNSSYIASCDIKHVSVMMPY